MKNTVLALVSISLLLLTTTVIAGNKARLHSDHMTRSDLQEPDFETQKQMRSDRLALQIEQLSAHKACIDTAIDNAGVTACNKTSRETMQNSRPNKGQVNKKGMQNKFDATRQNQEASTDQ